MKLIVGLGNPGNEYKKTRHNVGFMFIETLEKSLNLTFSLNKQFKCLLSEKIISGEKVIFCKPVTYMNLSGEAVSKVCKYYKIEIDDILVIHDDLDLPVGKVRIRKSGSSGGQKGMKNIIDLLGSSEIKRIRIGIGKNGDTINHVLGNFSKDDQITIDLILDKSKEMVEYYLENTFDNFMSRYNGWVIF